MKATYTLTALITGILAGAMIRGANIVMQFLDILLFALILQVGIEVGLEYENLRKSIETLRNQLYLPIITITTSTAAGIIGAVILNMDYRLALAISLGMGWYSFTGAYVTAKVNPYYGAIAFIANMFRETATMIITPILPKRMRRAGIIIGGATTMDTTLPIITKSLGEENIMISLYHGLVITIIIPLILSIII